MDAPNLNALNQMHRQFVAAGKNYIRLGAGEDDARVTTSGALGRLAARSIGRNADANRQTIDNLLDRLANTPGVGRQFADTLRGRIGDLYEGGKPLSGRAAAALVESAIAEVSGKCARQGHIELNIADVAGKITADGLIKTYADDLVGSLGISENELRQWEGEIRDSAKAGMTAEAALANKSPTEAEIRQSIRMAVTTVFIDHRGPAELETAKANKQYPAADMNAMMTLLRTEFPREALEKAGDPAKGDPTPDLGAAFEKSCSDLVHRQYWTAAKGSIQNALDVSDAGSPMCAILSAALQKHGIAELPNQFGLNDMAGKIIKTITNSVPDSGPLPPLQSRDQILETAAALVDKFLADPDSYGAGSTQLGEAEIGTMRHLLRANLSALKPAFYGGLETMQKAASGFVNAIAGARNKNEAMKALSDFSDAFNGLGESLPKGADSDDLWPMLDLGIEAALERPDTGGLLGRLAAPGGPFLAALHARVEEAGAVDRIVGAKFAEKLRAAGGARLAENFAFPITESLLPLRERTVMEGHTELPPPPGFSDRDMIGWQQRITQSLTNQLAPQDDEIANDSDPNSPQWTIRRIFEKDAPRVPFILNGTRVTSGAELFDIVPTRREAAQIARLVNQALNIEANNADTQEAKDYFMSGWTSGILIDGTNVDTEQLYTIDSLGGGAYRIGVEMHKHAIDETRPSLLPGSPPVTNFLHQLSFTLHTGDAPSVSDFQTDTLLLVKEE